jgi:hypothetical protein
MAKDAERFETLHDESTKLQGSQVLRDRETGVCYLFRCCGTAAGLTALLTRDGAPVVVPAH